MLGDNVSFKTIRLKNFLSFGDPGLELECKPLNVFIGQNGAGKSNLIEALNVLKAAPRDIADPFRKGGGIKEYLWKGTQKTPVAEISIDIHVPEDENHINHFLSFSESNNMFSIVDENIRKGNEYKFQFIENKPVLDIASTLTNDVKNKLTILEELKTGIFGESLTDAHRMLFQPNLKSSISILSQIKQPDLYPELYLLEQFFESIRIFRELALYQNSSPKRLQPADLPGDFLMEDAGNLGLVLNDLQRNKPVKKKIEKLLKDFYPPFEEYFTITQGNAIQIFINEVGLNHPTPASRLSDGTLRYLCLLAILCHPTPPPVVCIEETELGLHPDVLPPLAELMIDASNRTQLFVTTHSDILVSALSSVPESIVICERADEGTTMRRLEKDDLREWLKRYQLGELWTMGELGGNRW